MYNNNFCSVKQAQFLLIKGMMVFCTVQIISQFIKFDKCASQMSSLFFGQFLYISVSGFLIPILHDSTMTSKSDVSCKQTIPL
jgi:hypothetical protein